MFIIDSRSKLILVTTFIEFTAAIFHVSENVIFLGATVCHLKQAGGTLKQLTVLPSQVLAV